MSENKPRRGWHPDPYDSSRLRFHDGDSWTGKIRPAPRFLHGRGDDPDAIRWVRLVWRITMAIGLMIIAVWILAFLIIWRNDPIRTIQSEAYISAANEVCSRAESRIESLPPPETATSIEEQARRVELLNEQFARVTSELADLEVASSDRVLVSQWMQAWEDFVDAGAAYASALRSGDRDAYEAAARATELPNTRVALFALGNGLESCVFEI